LSKKNRSVFGSGFFSITNAVFYVPLRMQGSFIINSLLVKQLSTDPNKILSKQGGRCG